MTVHVLLGSKKVYDIIWLYLNAENRILWYTVWRKCNASLQNESRQIDLIANIHLLNIHANICFVKILNIRKPHKLLLIKTWFSIFTRLYSIYQGKYEIWRLRWNMYDDIMMHILYNMFKKDQTFLFPNIRVEG